MQFKQPKDDLKYHWTQHVGRKMMQYGLSADRIKRVMRYPRRVEKGIAPDTVAVMQPAGSEKNPSEIWVMYAQSGAKKKAGKKPKNPLEALLNQPKKIVITAWRYPGVSPVRDQIPIPSDILAELKDGEWL